MSAPDTYRTAASAALALLNSGTLTSRPSGAFCGQLVVDQTPLTPKQEAWLGKLLERAELPPLAEGGGV